MSLYVFTDADFTPADFNAGKICSLAENSVLELSFLLNAFCEPPTLSASSSRYIDAQTPKALFMTGEEAVATMLFRYFKCSFSVRFASYSEH